MPEAEIIVIGAGTVGAAIAYGLSRLGHRTLVLDGTRRDFRAARADFGLVWVQGKGPGMPAYQAVTRTSSDAWPDFEAGLREASGQTTLEYERRGGVAFCLGEEEFAARNDALMRLHNQAGGDDRDTEMVDHAGLKRLLPSARLGPDVTGASYCWRDGHTNPLLVLYALQAAIRRLGGEIVEGAPVTAISRGDRGGSVGLNSFRAAAKWISALVTPPPGLASASARRSSRAGSLRPPPGPAQPSRQRQRRQRHLPGAETATA